MPKFEEENIKVWNRISCDACEEAVLLFNEKDIHKVHGILKFMIKGKNEQLKEYKQKLKEEKLRLKTEKNDKVDKKYLIKNKI